ncbi:MAG: site-2 protease family protein [Armatimonadetes bacterium]|nr:site-2 protease family protein [Armatimonadota bacterium]
MNGNIQLYSFLLSMVALVICITIHEFAHAFAAWKAGDETPHAQGRISLNPIDHLDPMGTVMMVVSSISGFGIGWGKPVRINPGNFRSPRWDNFRVSLWGPLSNLITAFVVGIVLRMWGNSMSSPMAMFMLILLQVNIGLALFNLIPIHPLDGSHIMSSLLPYESARKYDYFMARHGMLAFIGLIVLGNRIFPIIIGIPARFLMHAFVGI